MADAWLTPNQASEHAQVSIATLKRAVKAGTLQAYRIKNGRLVRYRREDIDAWLSPVNEAQS